MRKLVVLQFVSRLKQQPGGDILINGSAQLIRTLMEEDLIDEYGRMVFPVVLGGGKRLLKRPPVRPPCDWWR